MKALLIALIASTAVSTLLFAEDKASNPPSAPTAAAAPTRGVLTSTAPAATPSTSAASSGAPAASAPAASALAPSSPAPSTPVASTPVAPAPVAAAPLPVAPAPSAPVASTAAPEPEHAETTIPAPAPAPVRKAAHEHKEKNTAQASKKVVVNHATFDGGEGSSWKTGQDAYGFEGSFGGCHYRGHVSPSGYTLDKTC